MSGQSTLIVTTLSGVRPLGVRGQPLHNSAVQLIRIARHRLGGTVADLLAEPQLHADGKGIDWYANWPGEVRRLVDLDPKERGDVLSQVDRGLIEIARLGQTLSAGDEGGAIGRSLQLAARRPDESFVFLVGEKPVVVCWGYEKEAAQGLLPPALARLPSRQSVLEPPPLRAFRPRVVPAPRSIPWGRTVLLALPLLLLLLGAAWFLRNWTPDNPFFALVTKENPAAPQAPAPPTDRRPILKASLSQEQARAKALQVELAAIEGELKKRVAACKPPEPPPAPKPPQVAVAPPPPKPAPPPPQPQPQRPSDNRLRLPTGPTRDFSFLQGCWRSDRFKHELAQLQPGVSSYCFDANGYGQLEWRSGRLACRTSAQARFDGSTLRLHDSDTTCNDGSHWYADQLVCQRGADNVAQCSGYSRGAFGPATWTVNLHKLE